MAIPRQRVLLPPSFLSALAMSPAGLLSRGDFCRQFEENFASAMQVKSAVATPSGRAALRFIIEALGLQAGDEIICSAYGYPVVPYLVRQLGYALRLADCEMTSLGMDPHALEAAITPRTRAVIVTHLFGVPCDIAALSTITRQHGVALIEDCAHACGASVGGMPTGAWGDAAYFSFETSKSINTLGGGMITLREDKLENTIRGLLDAEAPQSYSWLAKRLASTFFEALMTNPLVFSLCAYPALRILMRSEKGKSHFSSGYDGDAVSMVGRMGRYTEYQAQLGLPQLAQLERDNTRRRALATSMIASLKVEAPFQQPTGEEAIANYMLLTARFLSADAAAKKLLLQGVDCKHHYMRDCSALLEETAVFPKAAQAQEQVLHLPAYPGMSEKQQQQVVRAVKQLAKTAPGLILST